MPKETSGVAFPLEITSDNAGYRLSDVQETVKFNIKNVILTNPGERIWNPDFGVGIKRALFEQPTQLLVDTIQEKILEQISFYVPYIIVLQLRVEAIDENSIYIKLKYEIELSEIVDFIELDITNI